MRAALVAFSAGATRSTYMTAQPRRADQGAGDPPPAEAQPTSEGQPSGVLPASATNTSGFHAAVPQRQHVELHPTGKRLAFLSVTALGIVYGDIGTSPLYALQQCFTSKEFSIAPTPANVYGVLSLIVWLLILVVAVKYIVFIMRADNRGEGGILALMALILQQERRRTDSKRRWVLIVLALFGAALLYGDGIITPSITVLGAVEGLGVATPAFSHVVVPISLVILFGLFTVQRFGTGRIGALFGPIMALWFVTIAALGFAQIVREPRILSALNPWHGVTFFVANGRFAFLALGAVVLAVTGAEALYADMGHFGKRPIRIAWFSLVLPALMTNYLGQGALLLHNPGAVTNPFYLLAPRVMLFPLVVLAAIAAVIASQALISGAFSLTQQAVQLGYSPRMTVVHTSAREAGPDLHSRDQPAADGRLPHAGARLPVVQRARRRVRHRRHRHDGDHVGALLRRRALAVELVARGTRCRSRSRSSRSTSRCSRRTSSRSNRADGCRSPSRWASSR